MRRPARSPSGCAARRATCARRYRARSAARRAWTSSHARRSSMPRPDEQRRAAALRYDGDGAAPKVVAAGRGEIAKRIIEEARANGVPIRDDAALAESLAKL